MDKLRHKIKLYIKQHKIGGYSVDKKTAEEFKNDSSDLQIQAKQLFGEYVLHQPGLDGYILCGIRDEKYIDDLLLDQMNDASGEYIKLRIAKEKEIDMFFYIINTSYGTTRDENQITSESHASIDSQLYDELINEYENQTKNEYLQLESIDMKFDSMPPQNRRGRW